MSRLGGGLGSLLQRGVPPGPALARMGAAGAVGRGRGAVGARLRLLRHDARRALRPGLQQRPPGDPPRQPPCPVSPTGESVDSNSFVVSTCFPTLNVQHALLRLLRKRVSSWRPNGPQHALVFLFCSSRGETPSDPLLYSTRPLLPPYALTLFSCPLPIPPAQAQPNNHGGFKEPGGGRGAVRWSSISA